MMKVAYINCLVSKGGFLGIEKKLLAQAEATSMLGLSIDFFYADISQKLRDKKIHFFRQGNGVFDQRLSVLHRYSNISRRINTDRYDLIVLRYSGADFSTLSKFFRDNARKIVTEHHTKELQEAYTYESMLPQKVLTLLMEKFLGPRVVRRCAGLIAVTDEIREYELKRANTCIPTCTIPNGVLVQGIPFSGHAEYNGEVLNLLCLANTFEAWQGLDRILAGLVNYSSRKPLLRLVVVGDVPVRYLNMASGLLHSVHARTDFLGKLHGDRLEDVFRKSHVAFSSLALFRKGMKEACSLKTREFMARGLPFAIGYQDPDLANSEDFFFRIPPDESPVNMDDIVAFAERSLRQRGMSESMRQFAETRLDWKIKMQQMWSFLESVFQETRLSAA